MILNQAAIRLGVQMRITEDDLTKNMLAATANMLNCVNGAAGDLPTEITPSDILDATTRLQTADAMTIGEMEEGENKFGKLCAEVKSSLIDLEALWGDKAEGICHGERLSEKTQKWDAIV